MGTKSLLLSALMMAAACQSNYPSRRYYSDKQNVDHRKNIKPYHEKPLKKGAFQKHLSKKQRKNQIQ